MTFLNRIELSLLTNERPWCALKFKRFCCDEPRNFANWPAEFGRIFRGKLWALVITVDHGTKMYYHHLLIAAGKKTVRQNSTLRTVLVGFVTMTKLKPILYNLHRPKTEVIIE